MMRFQNTLNIHFPNAISEIMFVAQSTDWLHGLGFSAENSLISLGRCRDELTIPLLQKLRITWGNVFDLTALGGMLFAGKTGFSAAIAHAPTQFDRYRYLFFAFSHIGIDADGNIGLHLREGQSASSTACGALSALRQELQNGKQDLTFHPNDIEQSLLRQRLIPLVEQSTPDLVTLTKMAREAISADLHQMIDLIVDPKQSDYAILTGIQIHAPQQRHFIWLAEAQAVVNGITTHYDSK